MTVFHVPWRNTTLTLVLSPEDMHQLVSEASRAADLGVAYLVTVRRPGGNLELSPGASRELVEEVRRHLAERVAS